MYFISGNALIMIGTFVTSIGSFKYANFCTILLFFDDIFRSLLLTPPMKSLPARAIR